MRPAYDKELSAVRVPGGRASLGDLWDERPEATDNVVCDVDRGGSRGPFQHGLVQLVVLEHYVWLESLVYSISPTWVAKKIT